MSLESEMKKFNTNLERLVTVIGALAPDQPSASFNPVTETKIVEPETKKVAAVEDTPDTPDEFDEFADDEPEVETADERPPLTSSQLQTFAKEVIAKNKTKDPKVKAKIKKKIIDLGFEMVSDLDQKGLVELEKFLSSF